LHWSVEGKGVIQILLGGGGLKRRKEKSGKGAFEPLEKKGRNFREEGELND